MSKLIKRFIDEVEPIGVINIGGQEYKVFSPEDLEERYYIQYFYARAKSLDIVKSFSEERELDDGEKIFVPSPNPADTVRMEIAMLEPAKEMITALLQIDLDELKVRPKFIIAIYDELENILREHNQIANVSQATGEQEEYEPIDPLEKTKKR